MRVSFFGKKIQATLSLATLVAYIGFITFGFIHIMQMVENPHLHEHGTDCPFVEIVRDLCTPTLINHTKLLQDLSSLAIWNTLSFSFTLLSISFLIFFLPSFVKDFLYAQKHSPPRQYSLYQYLFAQGTLHSKAH